jgi:hypothetical protein
MSETTVWRVWRSAGLKPHRTETFKFSLDPALEAGGASRLRRRGILRESGAGGPSRGRRGIDPHETAGADEDPAGRARVPGSQPPDATSIAARRDTAWSSDAPVADTLVALGPPRPS